MILLAVIVHFFYFSKLLFYYLFICDASLCFVFKIIQNVIGILNSLAITCYCIVSFNFI